MKKPSREPASIRLGCLLTWYGVASQERVAGETLFAGADGTVVNHLTLGIQTANSDARVNTFLIGAGSVLGALRADGALGTATWRAADERRQARAYCLTVKLAALTVRSAG